MVIALRSVMQPLPHLYTATATARERGDVLLESSGLTALESAPPVEFGGPGDRWSPETLLVASVADCLILTFRAIARSARFEYGSIRCEVDGVLDRVDRVTRFTDMAVRARLEIPDTASPDEARRLLEKAKEHCLITNSVTARTTFEIELAVAPAVGAGAAAGATT